MCVDNGTWLGQHGIVPAVHLARIIFATGIAVDLEEEELIFGIVKLDILTMTRRVWDAGELLDFANLQVD